MEQFKPNLQPQKNSPEKKSGLEKVKEKSARLLKRLRQVGFVLILAGITNYQLTHNNEISSQNIDGKEFFTHSDKETTHILNYLGGLDSLTESDQINFIKQYFKNNPVKDLELPSNFDQMSDEEYLSWIAENNMKYGFGDSMEEAKQIALRDLDNAFPKKYKYNDTFYKKLWEVEKECGSPKIQWTCGWNRENLVKFSSEGSIARYNPLTHTVSVNASIGAGGQIGDLVSEFAHAKQFHDNPTSSTFKSIKEGIRIANKALKSKKEGGLISKLVASQLEEYNISGSTEHEAHKIIEPYLKEKFKEIKDSEIKNRTKF